MWSLRPCISARLYRKTLRGDWRTLFALISYSTNTISWSARPVGGILLTLVAGVGLFVSRMSRVLSCRVGISVTWERQYSWTISTKWDCNCLLGIPRGTYSLFQSISPQLKSPPMRTWEFLYAMIRFRELLSWSKYSGSVMSGGR